MKSQHRHDLQTNELGKVADRVVDSMGGFFETYGNRLLVGFCVAMVLASIVIYKVRRDRSDEAVAWRSLAGARNAEDYAGVWEAHPGTAAGRWARVQEGESRLTEGVQLLFTNVESGTKELKLARGALQELVDQKGTPIEIRERALFALARCLEAQSDGSETEAVKTYQTLLREFPATIYKKDAEDRIEALGSGSGQEFYDWFAKYPRPKSTEKRPLDRKMGDDDDLAEPLDPAVLEGDSSNGNSQITLPDSKVDAGADPLKAPQEGERKNAPDAEASAPDGEKQPDSQDEKETEKKPEEPESDSPAP